MAVLQMAKDLDYPITVAWLQEVRSRLGTERGAQARLAREIGCSAGTLTELLQNGKRSHLVPKISKALGLPMPLIMSPDTQEIVAFLGKMGDKGREALRGLSQLDRKQLEAILALIEQMPHKSND